MSRTFRRKSGDNQDKKYVLSKHVRVPGSYFWYREPMKPNSAEYIKTNARYHSDNYRNFKEPGPSWFRNLTAERPQRREAKRQLYKYMHDPEFEVILNGKDPLDYWT